MARGRNSMRRGQKLQRRLKKAWLAIKNTLLPFFILFVILRLPLATSVIFGPHVYLTVKTILSCSVLPLFVRLNKRPESRVLLALVLFAFRFTTASLNGSRTIECKSGQEFCIDEGDRETFFINESLSIAIAWASTMLAILLWEPMREIHRTPLNYLMLAYSFSAVVDFSLVVAEVLAFSACLCLLLSKILQTYRILISDRIHNLIEIIKSDDGYYIFWSLVMVCCINERKDIAYILHEVLEETAHIWYIACCLTFLVSWLLQFLVFRHAARGRIE